MVQVYTWLERRIFWMSLKFSGKSNVRKHSVVVSVNIACSVSHQSQQVQIALVHSISSFHRLGTGGAASVADAKSWSAWGCSQVVTLRVTYAHLRSAAEAGAGWSHANSKDYLSLISSGTRNTWLMLTYAWRTGPTRINPKDCLVIKLIGGYLPSCCGWAENRNENRRDWKYLTD